MEKNTQYLNDSRNPYRLRIKDMIVEIKYADNTRKINDCLLSILRQKVKWTKINMSP